ncbi:MAG: hypothetical protein HQK92_05150 [Nitrospirae bacterium]|nr:hypothetical protein [Nitrospirota bacterium]
MKVQGIIKGSNIVLKELPADEQFHEGAKVEVIVLPIHKKFRRFSTFKLGVKEKSLNREEIYERN